MKGREVGMKIMEKRISLYTSFMSFTNIQSKYFLYPTGKIKSRYCIHNQSSAHYKLVQNIEILLGKQIQNIIDIALSVFAGEKSLKNIEKWLSVHHIIDTIFAPSRVPQLYLIRGIQFN